MCVLWRDMIDEKPDDYQECITKTKKGYISGTYDPKDKSFFGVFPQTAGGFWKEINWTATHWAPIDEIKQENKMDSVGYLKRKYELTKDVIFLNIAQYIEELEKQLKTSKENECKCPK